MTGRRRLDCEQRGAISIMVVASLFGMLGLAAIVIDIGVARVADVGLQNASDAGALAGTFELPADAPSAIAAAAEYAYLGVDLPAPAGTACGLDTQCFDAGGYSLLVKTPYSEPGLSVPPDEAIFVEMCTSVPTFFGRLLGTASLTVCSEAVAAATPVTSDCVVCVLAPNGTSLSSTGAGTVSVQGGDMVVNSDDAAAVKLTGGGTITVDSEFGVYGGYSATAGSLTPLPSFHEPVADPLADLPVPVFTGSPAPKVSISGSADITLSPGIYSEIVSSSSGQITLLPGEYVVTHEIRLSKSPFAGNVSLYAHGVMVYFACANYPDPCASGESGANLSMSGGTSVSWTPPTSGEFQGLSLFYDRENTSTITLTGSSGSAFSGSVYAKSGTLSLTGPSGVDTTMESMVVVGNLIKTGDSAVNITYEESSSPFSSGSGRRRLVG